MCAHIISEDHFQSSFLKNKVVKPIPTLFDCALNKTKICLTFKLENDFINSLFKF